MTLKYRIDSVAPHYVEPVTVGNATAARKAFLAAVSAIAATDSVLGPDFIALAKTVKFSAPGPFEHRDWLVAMDTSRADFLDNYVRVDAWREG